MQFYFSLSILPQSMLQKTKGLGFFPGFFFVCLFACLVFKWEDRGNFIHWCSKEVVALQSFKITVFSKHSALSHTYCTLLPRVFWTTCILLYFFLNGALSEFYFKMLWQLCFLYKGSLSPLLFLNLGSFSKPLPQQSLLFSSFFNIEHFEWCGRFILLSHIIVHLFIFFFP